MPASTGKLEALGPSAVCDACLSEEYEWALLGGAGKVLSWTTFHRGYFPEYPPPHTVVVLELDEGPLFVSYPAGIEASRLAEGMRLVLDWEESEDRFGQYNLPVFRQA